MIVIKAEVSFTEDNINEIFIPLLKKAFCVSVLLLERQ